MPRLQQTKSSDALQHKNKNKTKIQGVTTEMLVDKSALLASS